MNIKGNHPLAEQIAAHLHGIERVPHREAARMVNRAATEAVKWHAAEIERLREKIVEAFNCLDAGHQDWAWQILNVEVASFEGYDAIGSLARIAEYEAAERAAEEQQP